MSALDNRMNEIEEHATYRYHSALLKTVGGDVRAAALLDLAMDGDTYWPDLRRRPFAGNERLKTLYRDMVIAQRQFHEAAIDIIRERGEM